MKNTMSYLNRRSALQLGSVVLLLGVQHIARGATIVAVRVWPSKDYTRLTIESDGEIKARQFFVAEPPRLAVDIQGIDLIPALRELVAKVKSDDPNISGIRVGQHAPGVVRLVVDLKKPMLPQVFTLPPVAAYQYRLVLDLYPAQAVDPLEALITERLAGKQPEASPAADAGNDPLGNLMAQQSGKAPSSSGKPANHQPAAEMAATAKRNVEAKIPALPAPAARVKKMWCCKLRTACATASTSSPTCAPTSRATPIFLYLLTFACRRRAACRPIFSSACMPMRSSMPRRRAPAYLR
jgi:N-acetylmuramoyl-L-alanine amidase